MKKLANIIYRDELINHTKVDYINYIQGDVSINDIDNDLPTLYVGWYFLKEVNENHPLLNHASILDKKIIPNQLYWEFSFNENKPQHVNGVDDFITDCLSYYFLSRYTYINLDPVFFSIKNLDDLFDLLPKQIDGIYNHKNEMLYLVKGNKITGIDLKYYGFFEFNIEEMIEKLISKLISPTQYFDDTKGSLFSKNNKIYQNFITLKRYMVVLLSN